MYVVHVHTCVFALELHVYIQELKPGNREF